VTDRQTDGRKWTDRATVSSAAITVIADVFVDVA